ncbi:MAG: dienelactone hydrolase family protein [Candidatus Hydrogenedentes bacterium]|nr:dienelactone hydrolase family protein [Candidatus Hydrogenedentota bacterium]
MKLGRRAFLKGVYGTIPLLVLPALPAGAEPGNVTWLGEVQRPPQNLKPTASARLEPLLQANDGTSITTVAQWEQQRASLRRQWMEFLGPITDRPPVRLATLSEDRTEGCRRLLVRYEAEAGQPVEGYLLYPEPLVDGPRPALVVLHSTTPDTIDEVAGIKGRDSRALGLKFAEQGFVVFCPKCFLWQDPSLDYEEAAANFRKSHPGTLGMRKMLHDAQRAVDVLVSLPEVDPSRIGALGHSLGAKETLYLMAFDERVRAGVFSEGGIGLSFTNWHDPWYLGAGIREPGFALDHHQLLALIAPRPFLILAGESGPPGTSVADGDRTWPYIEAALPVYRLYGEPARIGLYNHRQGHTIPAEAFQRMSEWLRTYLTSGT